MVARMGKLLSLFRGVPAQRTVRVVQGQLIDIEIVGESFHQDYIRRLRRKYQESEFPIVLVAEPNNPHDRNAVAVHVDGRIVGHLSRQMAPDWQPMVLAAAAEGYVVAGRASIWGGTPDKPNLGVFGSAPWPGPDPAPRDRFGRR
jgi:hypothetical protein